MASMGSTSSGNVSEEERIQYLDHLQSETTMTMIPAMVFLLLLAVVGLFGNSLVLVVYRRHFKQTSTRIFIMAIAIFDLVTNVLAIPGEVFDMFHRWNFNQPHLCGFRLTLNAFTIVSSALLLVALAVTRYRKVCRPHGKQTSIRSAKVLSAIITIAALVIAMPCAILNGRRTKRTPRADIQGQACNIDDRYARTAWPLVYMGSFIVGFFVCCTSLIILYILIGIQAWRHSSINRVTSGSRYSTYSSVYKTASETAYDEKDQDNDSRKLNTAQRILKLFHCLHGKTGKCDGRTRFYVDAKTEMTLDKASDSSDYGQETTDVHLEMQTMENPIANERDGSSKNEIHQNPRRNLPSDIPNSEINKIVESHAIVEDRQTDQGTPSRLTDSPGKADGSKIEACDEQKSHANHCDSVHTSQPTRKTSRCTFSVPEGKTSKVNAAESKTRKRSTKSQTHPKNRRPMTRTTIMLTAITAVYVIGFLPHLSLIIFRYSSSEIFRNMSFAGFTTYNLFLRFHFLNSASNAIIYNLCDKKFREHAKRIFKFRCSR